MPSHIVWSVPMVPGSKLLAVIFITLVSSVHVLAPRTEETASLYQVSCVSANGE